MFELVLVLSPGRPLDDTGWLDYVCLVGLILYYALAALCTLFVLVNVARRNMDVTILGWPGLLMIITGSCLDLTSEFVTNGHLDVLERLRTVDCHTWDYWIKFMGLGAFFSGLCICMVKSSALVYARLQKALSSLENKRHYTGNTGVYAPRARAGDGMETVDLDESPITTQPPSYMERPCFYIGCGWALRAVWSRMNPVSRLWALAAAAVTIILAACVFMVAASYLPGATVEVEEADTCYTSPYFKSMFVGVMAIFMCAGWATHMATTHTDIRAPLARVWKTRMAPVCAWSFETFILFLDKGVYVLGNPLSLAFFRAVAPLYLRAGGRRFISSPRQFMRVTGIYAARCAHRALSVLPAGCGCHTCMGSMYSDEAEHGYIADTYARDSASEERPAYFHAVASAQVSPAAPTASFSTSQALTGASFGRALAAISIGLVLRVLLNVAFLVSYMGGRALYFAVTELSYVMALSAVLGSAYMSRLRGLSPTADTIEAHAQAVPACLEAAIAKCNSRVIMEFFTFTTTLVKHAERSFHDRELVCLFSWNGMRNNLSFYMSFQDDVMRYVNTELVPRDSVEEHAGPEHVSGTGSEDDFPYDDAAIIYLPHVVEFLRAYLECESRFAEAMGDVVVPAHVDTQHDFLETDSLDNTTRCDLQAACERMYEALLGSRFQYSSTRICEEAAVPLFGNRRALINAQRNAGGATPEVVKKEAQLAIAILDESVWTQYAAAPESMTWLRVAKAHADSARLHDARVHSDIDTVRVRTSSGSRQSDPYAGATRALHSSGTDQFDPLADLLCPPDLSDGNQFEFSAEQ